MVVLLKDKGQDFEINVTKSHFFWYSNIYFKILSLVCIYKVYSLFIFRFYRENTNIYLQKFKYIILFFFIQFHILSIIIIYSFVLCDTLLCQWRFEPLCMSYRGNIFLKFFQRFRISRKSWRNDFFVLVIDNMQITTLS